MGRRTSGGKGESQGERQSVAVLIRLLGQPTTLYLSIIWEYEDDCDHELYKLHSIGLACQWKLKARQQQRQSGRSLRLGGSPAWHFDRHFKWKLYKKLSVGVEGWRIRSTYSTARAHLILPSKSVGPRNSL